MAHVKNSVISKESKISLPLPCFRRQTSSLASDCYHCGRRAEAKEVEYRCWFCNKFAKPLAGHAARIAFQRKGTGAPSLTLPNAWWIPSTTKDVSWYVWMRRWNDLPSSNLTPYWARKFRLKKMNDLINIWEN